MSNIRAALAWLLEHEPDDAVRHRRGAARDFWFARGYLVEGRRWFDDSARAVRGAGRRRGPARSAAASILASLQADWPEVRRLAEESRRL